MEFLAFSPVGIYSDSAEYPKERRDYLAVMRRSRANWPQCKTIWQSVLGDFYFARDSPIGTGVSIGDVQLAV